MLHLPGEAGNVLHIPSNDFVYVFFVFFCGHSIAASRFKTRRENRVRARGLSGVGPKQVLVGRRPSAGVGF